MVSHLVPIIHIRYKEHVINFTTLQSLDPPKKFIKLPFTASRVLSKFFKTENYNVCLTSNILKNFIGNLKDNLEIRQSSGI